MASISERLKYAMSVRNIKQVDLVNITGIGKSSISTYIAGDYKPKQQNIYKLAKALDVSEAWLLGYDVPMERNSVYSKFDNIIPIEIHKIPLLGEIACGKPIFANEDRESYVEVGTNIRADFCLKAKGDSMINARIYDGDIVFIREQPMVDNGEIAAVIIDDEATLKRVYYEKDKSKLVLSPENTKYSPLVYVGSELEDVRILGKAVAFQSDVR